jgi:hypothetical protein
VTWVHDRIFAAGGEHIPSNWASFCDQTGVSAVLHLAPEGPSRFEGPPAESFLWLDVVDEAQVDLASCLLAARFLHECTRGSRSALLHCSLGRHKTRWAFVAYRIYTGRSVRVALREAAERPWLSPYLTDDKKWVDFAASVKSRRAG